MTSEHPTQEDGSPYDEDLMAAVTRSGISGRRSRPSAAPVVHAAPTRP